MEWTEEEISILQWRPAEPIVEWIESNFEIAGSDTAEAGKYSFDRVPYLRKIAEEFKDTREIVIRKSAQCGYSWLFIGLMSYIIKNDPSDIMLVFPTDKDAGKFLNNKVYPAFQKQRALKKLLPQNLKDWTQSGIDATVCKLHVGYSGSAGSLASSTIRYIFADEISKFQGGLKEADPISLMTERQITYGNRARTIFGCTPTHDKDEICKLFDASGEQYYYHLPCAECNRLFNPTTKMIKWTMPEEAKATVGTRQQWLLENDVTRLECPHCGSLLTEKQRMKMLAKGRWLGKGQIQNSEGEIVGYCNSRAYRKAFQISKLITPWGTLVAHAVEFQQCLGDRQKQKNFANSWEGLPVKEESIELSSNDIQIMATQIGNRRDVPNKKGYLVASADTQDTSYHYSIWNIDETEAHLVDYGQVQDRNSLKEAVFREYGGRTPQCLAIDARGHRTQDIYHFATTDPRIYCVLGNNQPMNPPFKKTSTAEYNTKAYTIDTHYFKEKIHHWLSERKISTFGPIDHYWYESMTAERRIYDATKNKWTWQEIKKDKNHQFDCAVYAFFAYDLMVAQTGKSEWTDRSKMVRIPPQQLIQGINRRF